MTVSSNREGFILVTWWPGGDETEEEATAVMARLLGENVSHYFVQKRKVRFGNEAEEATEWVIHPGVGTEVLGRIQEFAKCRQIFLYPKTEAILQSPAAFSKHIENRRSVDAAVRRDRDWH